MKTDVFVDIDEAGIGTAVPHMPPLCPRITRIITDYFWGQSLYPLNSKFCIDIGLIRPIGPIWPKATKHARIA